MAQTGFQVFFSTVECSLGWKFTQVAAE